MKKFTTLAAAIGAAILALPAASQAAPGPACIAGGTPPSDINSYLALAKTHFETKGGGSSSTGNFLGGNVGVSDAGGTLQVGANGSFEMSAGTALVGDDSAIGDDQVDVGTVYANTTTSAILDASVNWANKPNPYCISSFPVVNNFPPDPVFTPGNSPADDVDTSGDQSLPPGPYGKITVNGGDALTLGSGTYNLFRLRLNGGTLVTQPDTVINIARDADGSGTWGTSNATRWFIGGQGVPSNENVLNFSVGSEVHGTFVVPNGEIALGRDLDFFGRIWGNSMHSDTRINMTYSAPALNTTASGTVELGGKIHDTAHLSGAINPTGSITFKLYGPNDADCSGSPVFTTKTPVNGNGSYDSAEFTPTAVGTYRWVASYSGDANNEPLADVCNAPNEAVVVTAPPCVPTAGQDKNCQPVTTACVPTANQDQNCKPKPPTSSATNSSKVSGVKAGCSTTSRVRVSGSNISKVTYKIDGKTVKTVRKSPYSYLLKTKDYKVGVHKLRVTTTYKDGKTSTKTITFQHCRNKAPSFTG